MTTGQTLDEILQTSKRKIISLRQERIDSIGACVASIGLALVCLNGWFGTDLLPISLRAMWAVILLLGAIYLAVGIYFLTQAIRYEWLYHEEVLHDDLDRRLN